jgi:Mg2+ and Co2+ transporter CorA
VRDFHQAEVANDQNEVMKRLTVVASVLLLPTFIGGLYEQNFKHIPETGGAGLRVVVGVDRRDHRASALVFPAEAVDLSR